MSWNSVAATIALVPLLLCACSGYTPSNSDRSDEALLALRAEVLRVVPDAGRREKLDATLDRYEHELRAFNRVASEFQSRLRALNADPDAGHARFTELIAEYEVERKAARARLVQLHHALLSATTDEEWPSIAKREVETLRLADAGKPHQEAQ